MTLDLCIVNFLCVTNKAWHHVSVNMDVIVSIYQVIKIKHLCECSGLQYYTFLLLQGFHTVFPLRRWTSALSLLTIPACSKCRPKIFFFDPRLAWLFGSLPSQYKVGVFLRIFLVYGFFVKRICGSIRSIRIWCAAVATRHNIAPLPGVCL